MHIENKTKNTLTSKTTKKSKKTAVKVETSPAAAVTPSEVRTSPPLSTKPAAPILARTFAPAEAKTVAPETRPLAPIEARPVIPPQPRVVLELVNPAAKQVCVAGSFNNWQPERTPLKLSGSGRWSGDLKVGPGRYEYLFVVDGQWVSDPAAKESVPNSFGSRNSVITVPSSN